LNSQKKTSNDRQKEIKQRLTESEEKYRLITENANDIISILNKKFEYEYVNEGPVLKYMGYKKEEIIGKSSLEFIHPDDIEQAVKSLKNGFKVGEGVGTVRLKHKKGHWVWLEVKGRTFIDRDGNEKGLVISRDITERKRAEEALRESNERLKVKLEFILSPDKKMGDISLTDLVDLDHLQRIQDAFVKIFDVASIIIDLEGKPITMGSNFCRVCQIIRGTKIGNEQCIKSNKLLGEKIKKFMKVTISKCQRTGFLDAGAPIIMAGKHIANWLIGQKKVIEIDKKTLEKYGKEIDANVDEMLKAYNKMKQIPLEHFEKVLDLLWILAKEISTLGYQNLNLAKDIEDRKKTQEALRKSEIQYREAYNLANFYRDLFAHDINNILQNILSSKEICSIYINDPKKLKDISTFLNIITEQVRRGAKLSRNVQKLSKLGDTQIFTQSIEVYTVLKSAIEYIQNSFKERKISIKIDDFTEKMFVQANDFLIDVFENILNNAVRHNESPSVEILIKCIRMQKSGLKYLKIEFIDNGLGIHDKRKEMIFKRVYKKDISIGGMGLGLSLVNKIIASYNGEIWVEDRVLGDYLKGSNFIILIPEVT